MRVTTLKLSELFVLFSRLCKRNGDSEKRSFKTKHGILCSENSGVTVIVLTNGEYDLHRCHYAFIEPGKEFLNFMRLPMLLAYSHFLSLPPHQYDNKM